MALWYRETGPESLWVLSSRVRLARNVADRPFPARMEVRELQNLQRELERQILQSDLARKQAYRSLHLEEISGLERSALMEHRLISQELARQERPTALVIREDEQVSVMLGEEDHIRIQAMAAGEQLEQAWREAQELAQTLEAGLDMAYDEQLGFLTACPSNLGTGLRASYLLHLPALRRLGQMEQLARRLADLGLTIRGALGEGSKAAGSLYQISNQVTLGFDEETLIHDLERVLHECLEMEQEAGQALLRQRGGELEDQFWRNVGILSYVREIGQEEMEERLSDLRWMMALGLLPQEGLARLTQLQADLGRAALQCLERRTMEAGERDRLRAEKLRAGMAEILAASSET